MSELDVPPKQPLQIFREACEECHQRKVRCVPRNGPCDNCVTNGRDCLFRQRSAMGRPRKQRSAGQQQTPRPRLAASRKLSTNNVKASTPEQQETARPQSAGLRHSSVQQSQKQNNHISSDGHSKGTNAHIAPSTGPPPYSFNQMAANYPLNLPDVDFDSYFDYSPGNITVEAINEHESFDPLLQSKNTDNNTLYSIIPMSSTILFELRRLCDRLSFMDTAVTSTELSDVLKHVSNFCALMLPKVSSTTLATQRWEETQTVAQLVVMIIATAMKCYSLLLQRQKDLVACSLQSKPLATLGLPFDQQSLDEITNIHATISATDPVHSSNQSISSHSNTSSSSVSPEGGGMMSTIMAWAASSSKLSASCGGGAPVPISIIPDLTQLKRRLATVIHLSIMDYHIAQFQWILAHLVEALGRLAIAGFQGFPLDELARLQKEAIQLRGRIQGASQEVRESYFA